MPQQLLQQIDEIELGQPYDPDYKPEYSSLFKATAGLVGLAYGLSLLAAFVSRSRKSRNRPPRPRHSQQWQQQQQDHQLRHRHRQPQPQQRRQQQQQQQWLRFSSLQQQQPELKRDTLAFRDTASAAGQRPAPTSAQHMPRDRHTLDDDTEMDRPFRKHQAHPPHQQQQQQPLQQQQQDRPFRFRAQHAEQNGWVAPGAAALQHQQQHQQQQYAECTTPPPPTRRLGRHLQQHRSSDDDDDDDDDDGWDPELLARCAATSPYIASIEGLQKSPAFRSHISKVRGRRLNYETAESHKLRVYKALRDVDPAGFSLLFSRKDVAEYDEVPPSQLLSSLDCLSSAALSLCLLGAPWLLPALAPYRAAGALCWLSLHLLLAAAGCSSLLCWIMNVHATHGEYSLLASWPRLLAAVLLEAALVVATGGLGLLVSLGCRLLGSARQSAGERLMGLVPMQEVVRPMRFSPLPPARSAAARGSFGVVDFSDDGGSDGEERARRGEARGAGLTAGFSGISTSLLTGDL